MIVELDLKKYLHSTRDKMSTMQEKDNFKNRARNDILLVFNVKFLKSFDFY